MGAYILKIAGDVGGCDDNSDASEDGRMGIERDAGGCAGDYGESGTSGPDGLDLDLCGRNACGDGSDGDGGEDGRMGLETDSGVVLGAEENADGAGEAAAPDAPMGHGPGGEVAVGKCIFALAYLMLPELRQIR